jgi:hypothetical protein
MPRWRNPAENARIASMTGGRGFSYVSTFAPLINLRFWKASTPATPPS